VDQLAELLTNEVTSTATDIAVAWRKGERLVQSYVSLRLEEVAVERDVLRQGGVYLITGGLGNVGLTLTDMLRRRYSAKSGTRLAAHTA